MQVENNAGDKTRKKAYSLEKFLDYCKNHKNKVLIDESAIEDAGNSPLHLYSKKEILDYLAGVNLSEFEYVNTRTCGYPNSYVMKANENKKPLVDSYKIKQRGFWDLYIAFCILKTADGWFIKSFHVDNTGETASLGEIMTLKIGKLK